MYFLGILSLPIAAGIYLLAGPIIHLVYGDSFQNTILPLQWLSWSLIFLFLNVPNSRLLLVSEHQAVLMRILIGSMTFNILLNILLDPGWGAAGAGFARLCSTMLFFMLAYVFVQRSLQKHNLFTAMIRPVLATLGMSLVVWLVRDKSLWVSIAVGAGVYFIALAALKGLPIQDELTGKISQYLSRIFGTSPNNH
jgi:O-antigen/teichoic acid export membrane protein